MSKGQIHATQNKRWQQISEEIQSFADQLNMRRNFDMTNEISGAHNANYQLFEGCRGLQYYHAQFQNLLNNHSNVADDLLSTTESYTTLDNTTP